MIRTHASWTGPRERDYAPDGVSLRAVVPPERWPFGPPDFHEDCCRLHAQGLFCDCKASDASDDEWGDGTYVHRPDRHLERTV